MAGHTKIRPLGMIQNQRTKKGTMTSKAKDIFPLPKDRHDLKVIANATVDRHSYPRFAFPSPRVV